MALPDSSQRLAQALEHHQSARLREAEAIYRQVLSADPNHVAALHGLGLLALQAGNATLAMELLARAADLDPSNPACHGNLGLAYKALGRLDDTIAAFRRALALRPDLPEARFNLAAVLEERGLLEEAIDTYRQCIAQRPEFADALNNLGNALRKSGRFSEARDALTAALRCRPDFAEAVNNLGSVCEQQGDLSGAIRLYARAASIRPIYPEARANLGAALQRMGTFITEPGDGMSMGSHPQAIQILREAMTQNPRSTVLHSIFVGSLNYPDDLPATQVFEEHLRFGQLHAAGCVPAALVRSESESDRPLRIGYVSPDLMDHPVARFIEPILAGNADGRVRSIIFSDVARPDAITARLRGVIRPEDWHSCASSTDAELAALVRNQQIDILVDLAGHMAGNRLPLFIQKPASVQVTYLGYPNTTGLPPAIMDYRLTDALCDPPGRADALHTERLFRLPRIFVCYAPPLDAPEVAPPPGLDAGYITFGSFSTPAKMTRRMLLLWARLLQRVPGSRLLLKHKTWGDRSARSALMDLFAQAGVAASRLELLSHEPTSAQHLSRYGQVDIALDTFPYHGTTTTCDAMWMGVPVVTLAGDVHRSRVGVSLLTHAGVPELIASNPEQYVDIGANLAGSTTRLKHFRENFRRRLLHSPLLDASQFRDDLAEAYRQMWRASRAHSSIAR